MGEQEALIAAIRRNPDDDLPRLVYADWLDEHDEPARAELIRLQCLLSSSAPGLAERLGAEGRVRQLLLDHSGRWTETLRRAGANTIAFTRGFPESFRIRAEDLLRSAEQLRGVTPITDLRLDGSHGHARRLAGCSTLGTVARLDLSGNRLSDRDLEELSQSRTLSRVTHLSVDANRFGDRGLRALMGGPAVPGLRCLTARGNRVRGAALACPGPPDECKPLRVLDLSDNRLGDHGVESLVRAGVTDGLDYLFLTGNGLGEPGRAALRALGGTCDVVLSLHHPLNLDPRLWTGGPGRPAGRSK